MVLCPHFMIIPEEVGIATVEDVKPAICVNKASLIQKPIEVFAFPVMEVSLIPLMFVVPTISFSDYDIHVAADYDAVGSIGDDLAEFVVELLPMFDCSGNGGIGIWDIGIEEREARIAERGLQQVSVQDLA